MRKRFQRGYPLSLLFIAVFFCAVLVALVRPLVQMLLADQLSVKTVLAVACVATPVTTLIGAGVGLFHHRQPWGMLGGAAIGFPTGLLVGPLVLLPAVAASDLFAVAIVASAVLVGMGAAVRFAALAQHGAKRAAGGSAGSTPDEEERSSTG